METHGITGAGYFLGIHAPATTGIEEFFAKLFIIGLGNKQLVVVLIRDWRAKALSNYFLV